MRSAGGLAILQIYDGGRIAKPELIGEQTMRAPSAVASLRPGARTPRAMTSDEVESLVGSFRAAAALARKAGFDGVEIHGANHYAVHQFFSPRANHRDDHWGGTLAKRMNFPLAVAAGGSRRARPEADRGVSRDAIRGRGGRLYARRRQAALQRTGRAGSRLHLDFARRLPQEPAAARDPCLSWSGRGNSCPDRQVRSRNWPASSRAAAR